MEFPVEIKEYILSYLPHPYKKPHHLDVIKNDTTFVNFVRDRKGEYAGRELLIHDPDGPIPPWIDSYIEYKKYIYAFNAWYEEFGEHEDEDDYDTLVTIF
jgi:hypothetical protein